MHFEPNVKLNIKSKLATNEDTKYNCSICVSDFDKDESIKQLECNHIFHSNCIGEWVKYKSECPCCRSYIQTTNECNMND